MYVQIRAHVMTRKHQDDLIVDTVLCALIISRLPIANARFQNQMLTNSHLEMIKHVDYALPVASVLQQVAAFLAECGWKLEIEDAVVEIPKDTELIVRSRAFIKADIEGQVFLDNHFEAVVLIGKVLIGESIRAKYGVLRIYFNLEGQFVSEDRYNKYA